MDVNVLPPLIRGVRGYDACGSFVSWIPVYSVHVKQSTINIARVRLKIFAGGEDACKNGSRDL